jgi:hypothetical protein
MFKSKAIVVFIVVLLCISIQPCYAGTFFDDFNDGNADGWWLGYSRWTPFLTGTWRVESGTLLQDQWGDQYIALVDGLILSSQSIETKIKYNSPNAYGGVTIWYMDDINFIDILIYPMVDQVRVNDCIDGSCWGVGPTYSYTYSAAYGPWYKLRVDANSITGELAVYVNDVYLFTYTSIPNRSGLSGLNNGNTATYWDDFRLISDDIPPVLVPITIDIKPGSFPNSINLGSKGVVPVAILTTPDFDASTVDPTTVKFADASPVKWNMEDVDGDGDMDMIFHFDTQDLMLNSSSTEATLTGKTTGGIDFEGTDSVNIVLKKGKK